MSLTNGTNGVDHAPRQAVEDFTRALEILESEYSSRDGLDIYQLMDTKQHGGLTYNDFLVLPGYIGTSRDSPYRSLSDDLVRLCCL